MWFYFLSHLIECAVMFSVSLGQEWTLSPLDLLLPELWKQSLLPFPMQFLCSLPLFVLHAFSSLLFPY